LQNIFVIGNGESRRGFDLGRLSSLGTVIGCNALYRDFSPDYLISVDRAMIDEICRSGYADQHRVIVNDRHYPLFKQHLGIQCLPVFWTYDPEGKREKSYRGWSSGPSAVGYATGLTDIEPADTRIYMIGFDFNGLNGQINNMYKGTDNYATEGKPETFFGNWVRQLYTIITGRPKIQFIRLSRREHVPPDFVKLNNFSNLSIDDFDQIVK
jgi:hypothetical protein